MLWFKESRPGGQGYFIGLGKDARRGATTPGPIVLTNDAATYTSAELNARYGPAPSNGTILGVTPYTNPYNSFTNNNNNPIGTLRTQVHELGHQLFRILTGVSSWVPEPEELGTKLDDCVLQRGGYRRR